MSCHDVGRALNSVGAVVLGMYDKGRIPLEEARELLVATRLGVHWCDGNEYEAVDELSKTTADIACASWRSGHPCMTSMTSPAMSRTAIVCMIIRNCP